MREEEEEEEEEEGQEARYLYPSSSWQDHSFLQRVDDAIDFPREAVTDVN